MAGIHDRETHARLQGMPNSIDDGSWPMYRGEKVVEPEPQEQPSEEDPTTEQAPMLDKEVRLEALGRAVSDASTVRPGYWW